MKINKIISALKDHFDKDFRKKLKKEESLKGLIARLEDKEKKLRRKLQRSHSDSERKLLKKSLEALKGQLKKARRMLD